MTEISKISRTYYLGFNLPIHILCVLGFVFLEYNMLHAVWFAVFCYLLIFGIGVNIGYHRLTAHNSFVPKYNWFRYPMQVLGLFSMMGGPVIWTQYHRYHHAFTDTEKDPHSPAKGKWYAHFLWVLSPVKIPTMVVKDLIKDKITMWINANCRSIVILTLCCFALIDYSLMLGLMLAMIISFNVEMSINSLFGHDKDGSKNTKWLQYITLGASLHDNHHRNPKDYNFATASGEVDIVKNVIDWIKK